jgi:hypothetical protein
LQSGLPRFETRHRVVLGRLRPSQIQPGDVARFTNAINAAARMIDVYQGACLVLQKQDERHTTRGCAAEALTVNERNQLSTLSTVVSRWESNPQPAD